MYQSRLSSLSSFAPPPPPLPPQHQAFPPPAAHHHLQPHSGYLANGVSPLPFEPNAFLPPANSPTLTPLEGINSWGGGVESVGGWGGGVAEERMMVPLSVPPVSPGLCVICEDRATGRHYGANSCDGCKGFFRRTIRKAQNYSCRFDKRCLIDKDKRNSCRYCRFAKCIEAGMKPDAVQNERDRIQSRRGSNIKSSASTPASPSVRSALHFSFAAKSQPSSPLPCPTSSSRAALQETIRTLMKAEEYYTASQLRATVITRTDNQMPSLGDTPRIANMSDISESMRQQLLLMVEWAKTLSPFFTLSMSDQVVLLRHYAAQHLLICVAYRSRSASDRLLLTNSTCLPRNVDSSEISDANHVTLRALDELVRPIKVLDVDEVEFVCLRAIVFFNPMARGLEDSVSVVGETRQTILGALQHHISTKCGESDPFRFANLLLLLPPLQAIAQNLREDLQLAAMFGMAQIDSLLQELLITDSDQSADPAGANGLPDSSPLLFDHIQLLNNDAEVQRDGEASAFSEAAALKTEA